MKAVSSRPNALLSHISSAQLITPHLGREFGVDVGEFSRSRPVQVVARVGG